MKRLDRLAISVLIATLPFTFACRQSEEAVTQTSEVVVLDDQPIEPPDPFAREFLVDGERAIRVGPGITPPKLVSRGPAVTFPSSNRRLCFPGAKILVVVDKLGGVTETEIIDVKPVVEYVANGRRILSPEESLALLEEREFAIHNWQYEPAMQDGKPVPSVIDAGWTMYCR